MAVSETIAGYTLLGMDPSAGARTPLPGPAQTGQFRDKLARMRHGEKLPKGTKEPTEFREALAARRVAQEDARIALATHRESRNDNTPDTARLRWNAGNPVMDTIYGAHDRVAAMPAPGGIGALVLVIVIFLLVLMPISGHDTRLALLWQTLIGQKRLEGEPGVTAPAPAGTFPASQLPGGTGSGPVAKATSVPTATGSPVAAGILHIVPDIALPWLGVL